MISSQRPMMLSSAIELLNLVKQQQCVTWTDIQSVDIYILEMRKIMEKISLENQTLANYHQSISNKVNLLINVIKTTFYLHNHIK